MRAIELTGFNGLDSLRLSDVETPRPGAGEVLIKVRGPASISRSSSRRWGDTRFTRPRPGVLGFGAAGEVVELGDGVSNLQVGDRIVAPVSSGGYAEYATASANLAIPIPGGITFAQATSIVIQGISAYASLSMSLNRPPMKLF